MKDCENFLAFCRLQLVTVDYDAHLPFLQHLAEKYRLTEEEALWLGLLYMAFYTEGSAWVAFQDPEVRARQAMPPLDLPITVQRRNLYGGKIKRHLDELLAIPSLSEWVRGADSWSGLLEIIGSVWGNGRWASYTTSELLVRMAGLPFEPTTFEILGSSGPRAGLEVLGLKPNERSAALVHDVLLEGGMDVPSSVLESLLCDWAGMKKGTFYAGRNIDRQQGRLLDVERRFGVDLTELWVARAEVFPEWSLGECGGWEGIDRDRLKIYNRHHTLLRADQSRGAVGQSLLSHARSG